METLLALDTQIFLALNFAGGEFLDGLFWTASSKLFGLPLYALVIYLLVKRYGWKRALLALLCIALMVILVDHVANFFKTYTPKLRPSRNPALEPFVHTVNGYRGGKYGTVSAHAATVFTVALASASLIRNRIFTVVALLWAVLVSYSRIYLGVHFPLDVLFGTIAGCVFSVLALKLYYKTSSLLKL